MLEVKDGTARIDKRTDIDAEELREALVDRVDLELLVPREFGGEKVERLMFEEPTGEHIEQVSRAGSAKAQVEVSFRVLGQCTGLGTDEVKKLGGRDLSRLGQILNYFLPDARPGQF